MKMRRLLVFLICFCAATARAHLGSPDIFFDGPIGPYATQVTIGMPGVVPGRANISVRVLDAPAVTVAFRPLYNRTAASNAPPAEAGVLVTGETNLYSGELWLMAFGAYSIEISVRGPSGHGTVQIPVNSVASRQLPMPPSLGFLLAVLGALLVCGGVAIVAAAASESTLAPEEPFSPVRRRNRYIAATVTAFIFALALFGGKRWWDADEHQFRARLRDGGWPDLHGEVRFDGHQRVLALTLGEKDFDLNEPMNLAPDHGKLLHLFLIREPAHDAIAHVHPVRKGNHAFELDLPPLPAGDYEMLCDLTLESGTSSTATNIVHLPPPRGGTETPSDPDDSWAVGSAVASAPGADTIFHFTNGIQLIWKAHPPLQSGHDARLNFIARDAAGEPLRLEPYMGMSSHVAVLRSDGRVFAHLHPTGNFSMAAQAVFDTKIETESAAADLTTMGEIMRYHRPGASSGISIPYQFPSPGRYRIWVQFKTAGRVLTGIFDTDVGG